MFHIVSGIQKKISGTGQNLSLLDLAHKDAASHRDLYLGPPDYEGFKVII